jgi:hypothetical protein
VHIKINLCSTPTIRALHGATSSYISLCQFRQNSSYCAEKTGQIRSRHITHMGNAEGFPFDLAITVVKGKTGFTQALFQGGQIYATTVSAASQGL